MQDQIQAARTWLRMAWLHRWAGLAVTVSWCLVGWFAVQAVPDRFEASARIYLDTRSMLRPLLKGIAFDSSTLADTTLLLSRTLLSRPNLEEVARRTDLDLKAKTPEDFDRLIMGLASGLRITGTRNDNVYELRYEHANAVTAKSVVEALLNRFMETALGDTRRETATTRKFLDDQIAAYEQRLIEAEDRLKNFKQQNLGVMPSGEGGYFERLEAARNQMREANLKLQEALRGRNQLQRQAGLQAAGPSAVEASGDAQLAFLDARLRETESRLNDLLLNYTDRHPDVVGLRKLGADFRAQRAARLEALARTDGAQAVPLTPLRQQLAIEVAQADAQVASLQARVEEYGARVRELEQKIDTVPAVEAELSRLNRDYAVNKQQYDELLQRREQAWMAQEADQRADEVKVKIIEPPRVPLLPAGPHRLLLASLVLISGLALGAAACGFLVQLDPRVVDEPDLRELTGLPVLGAIGLVAEAGREASQARELLVFVAALLGVIGLYAAQATLMLMDVNLHARLARLIGHFT